MTALRKANDKVRASVMEIGGDIVKFTRASGAAAADSARCIADIIEARRDLRLPLDLAADELHLLHEGLGHQLRAYQKFVEARLGMVKIPRRIGMDDFGPDCPCEGGITQVTPISEAKAA